MIILAAELSKKYKIKKRRNNKILDFLMPEYENIDAVKDVSFSIEKGEIVGLIGKNGAGKSTLIKMMSGILYPSSGKVLVNEVEPYKYRKLNAQNIGVVFGQRSQLWWDIPIIESFKLFQKMYHIPMAEYEERISLFIDLFQMKDYIEKPVRQLSLGQRICSDLCASMLHNPPILFLDEPTIGLDVLNKSNMRMFVKEVNKKFDTTIILTSHDIDDIEELCKRVILMDKGIVLFDGKVDDFKREIVGYERIFINYKFILLEKINSVLFELGVLYKITDNKLEIEINKKRNNIVEVLNGIMPYVEIQDMEILNGSMEEALKLFYGKKEA